LDKVLERSKTTPNGQGQMRPQSDENMRRATEIGTRLYGDESAGGLC
jgi:hypothetical protein